MISMNFLVPFIVQNIKKIYKADPELLGTVIFGPILGLVPTRVFFSTVTVTV